MNAGVKFLVVVSLALSSSFVYAQIPKVLERAAAEYLFTQTQAGRKIISTVTQRAVTRTVDAGLYRTFLSHLTWEENSALASKLAKVAASAESELLSKEVLDRGVAMNADHSEALQKLADEAGELFDEYAKKFLVDDEELKALLKSSAQESIDAGPSKYRRVKEAFNRAVKNAKDPSEPATPESAEPTTDAAASTHSRARARSAMKTGRARAATATVEFNEAEETLRLPIGPEESELDVPDLDMRQLKWYQSLGEIFKAGKRITRGVFLTEGDWRTLFGIAGDKMTPLDLIMVRRVKSILETVDNMREMELILQQFTQENPVLLSRLFEECQDSIDAYLAGQKDSISLLDDISENIVKPAKFKLGRNKVDAGKSKLQLNLITPQALRRILITIERLRSLGGGIAPGGRVIKGEINIVSAEIERINQELETVRAKLIEIEAELSQSGLPKSRRSELLRAKNDSGLKESKLAHEKQKNVKTQENLVNEFSELYETIPLFANLRKGRMGSDFNIVAAVPIPDPWVINKEQVAQWRKVYDRAKFEVAAPYLFKKDVKAIFKSSLYRSQSFAWQMNKWTKNVVDKKFTETQLGQSFRNYARNGFLKVTGLMISAVTGYKGVKYTDDLKDKAAPLLEKKFDDFWKKFTGDKSSPAPASTDTDSTDTQSDHDSSSSQADSSKSKNESKTLDEDNPFLEPDSLTKKDSTIKKSSAAQDDTDQALVLD